MCLEELTCGCHRWKTDSRQNLFLFLPARRMVFTLPKTAIGDSNLGTEPSETVFSVFAYGARIEFQLPPALLGELPSPIVPDAKIDDRGPSDAVLSVRLNRNAEGESLFEIAENGMVLGTEVSLRAAKDAVESWAQLAVARLAKGLIFVHAGVVGWRDRAIVIPGRSLSGKTTLVLALVEAGADYYSDEYAIFDSEGRVHPYWRLPKLKAAPIHTLPSRDLGSVLCGPPPRPIPLGWVFISRYEDGSSWQPRRLTCGGTLLGLLDNTIPLRSRPEESVKALAKAMTNAQGFEGLRGEAASFARQVLASL